MELVRWLTRDRRQRDWLNLNAWRHPNGGRGAPACLIFRKYVPRCLPYSCNISVIMIDLFVVLLTPCIIIIDQTYLMHFNFGDFVFLSHSASFSPSFLFNFLFLVPLDSFPPNLSFPSIHPAPSPFFFSLFFCLLFPSPPPSTEYSTR